ncbi:adenine deaminase C-terminal domain-containing protein [Olsenella sp. AGMB03486]|uniref:adenine deaminase C-terminal domain-containing protein n=1 Tax=Olsenella sp. AGMB03486 TaxID=3230364 RepID=UPI0034A056AC
MKADLLLQGAQVFDSAYRCFRTASVAILDGRILYAGTDEEVLKQIEPQEVADLSGRWVIPGLIDIHMHIESSMVTPPVFLKAALQHGTSTCIAEPHEIANVFGTEGIEEFIRLAPADDPEHAEVFFGAPSSVPSTDLEDAGAAVTPEDISFLMKNPRVRCLGEVMDCRTVISEPQSRAARVVKAAEASRTVPIIEGHVPAFLGLDLARILYAGIDSDHCEQTPERMRQRFEMGMFVEVQLKSVTKENIAYLAAHPELTGLWSFVTDDVMADQLQHDHLARVVRQAISYGLDPASAIIAATSSPAVRMDLRDRGRIAPGRLADLVVLDSLEGFHVASVMHRGCWVDRDSADTSSRHDFPERYYESIHLAPRTLDDFVLSAPKGAGAAVRVHTMEIQERSTFTPDRIRELPVEEGHIAWKRSGDLALARVFERHHHLGLSGTALLSGACLKEGAVASTWVHDHHNLLVVGVDEEDMVLAANSVIARQGGLVVVRGGKIVAEMPLPVAGILTEDPLPLAAERLAAVTRALRDQGWGNSNPVMSLCTIALPVSPALKVTDRGLVDVRQAKLVDLVLPEEDEARG